MPNQKQNRANLASLLLAYLDASKRDASHVANVARIVKQNAATLSYVDLLTPYNEVEDTPDAIVSFCEHVASMQPIVNSVNSTARLRSRRRAYQRDSDAY